MPKNPGSPLASTHGAPPGEPVERRLDRTELDPLRRSAPEPPRGAAGAPTTTSAPASASAAPGGSGPPSIPITVRVTEPGARRRAPPAAPRARRRRACGRCGSARRGRGAMRVPVAASAGPTRNSVCRHSLRSLHTASTSSSRQAHGQLVGPAGAVGHDHRGVVGVAAGPQLLDQLRRAGGRQEDRHRGAVPGELAQLLPLRHRGLAALEPAQHHRLRHLGDRQLAARRRPPPRRTPRPRARSRRRARAPGPRRTAPAPRPTARGRRSAPGRPAGRPQPRGGRARARPRGRSCEESTSSASARACSVTHSAMTRLGRPDDDVGLGDAPGSAQRDQVGGARPGPDERHSPALHAPSLRVAPAGTAVGRQRRTSAATSPTIDGHSSRGRLCPMPG